MIQIPKIAFIGGGRITQLLLRGLKNNNALPEETAVSDPDLGIHKKIQSVAGDSCKCFANNREVLNTNVLFLAVHPPVIKDVCAEIVNAISPHTVIVSLAPVLPMQKLTGLLNGHERLVRMIPNAPSLINKGYNPVIFGSAIDSDDKQVLQALFNNWGDIPEVDETTLEAYAILTGMGPTYFWPQWQTLRRLGAGFGLADADIDRALAAMLHGSVDALFNTEMAAEAVLDLVPVYPMKPHEEDINEKFAGTLIALHNKLTGK